MKVRGTPITEYFPHMDRRDLQSLRRLAPHRCRIRRSRSDQARRHGGDGSVDPAPLRREADEGRIHLLSIEEQPLRRPIELLWRAARPLKATARAFLSSLVGQYSSLLDEVVHKQKS